MLQFSIMWLTLISDLFIFELSIVMVLGLLYICGTGFKIYSLRNEILGCTVENTRLSPSVLTTYIGAISDDSVPRLHTSPRRSIGSSITVFHIGIAWRITCHVLIRAAHHVTMHLQVMCSGFAHSPSDGGGYYSKCGAGSVDLLTPTYRTLCFH